MGWRDAPIVGGTSPRWQSAPIVDETPPGPELGSGAVITEPSPDDGFRPGKGDQFRPHGIPDIGDLLPAKEESSALDSILPFLSALVNPGAAGMAVGDSIADAGIRYPRAGVQGSGRGLANIAGAPFDLTNAAGNALLTTADFGAGLFGGRVPYRLPTGAADTIADAASSVAETLGYDVLDPDTEMTPAERLAYHVNDFGTQAGIAGSLLASAPAQAVRATQDSPRVVRAIESLAAPYQKSAAPLAGDLAAGAGAGAGVAGYDEYAADAVQDFADRHLPPTMAEWATPVGKALSAMVGGLGGVSLASVGDALARGGVNTAKTMVTGNAERALPVNQKTGQPFSIPDANMAARIVQQAASDPQTAAETIRANANELLGAGVAGQPRGAVPPSGLLSDDVGLIGFENAARTQGDPKLKARFIEQGQRTNTAARELVDQAAPETGVGRAFTDTVEGIQADRVASAQSRVDTLEGRQATVDRALAGQSVPVAAARGGKPAASTRLDETVAGTLTRDQTAKNAAFDAIDPNREVPVPPEPLLDAAADIRAAQGPLNNPGNVPEELLARIERIAGQPEDPARGLAAVPPTPITYGDVQALRPELAAAESAARQAQNYPLADNLRALRSALGRVTEELGAAGDDLGAAGRAQTALDIYANDFMPTWNRGPGDAATQFRKDFNKDRGGRTTTPPSATADRFLQPGAPEKSEALNRILQRAENPQAGRKAAEDFLLADLAESGVLDQSGALRPDILRRWQQKWGDQISVAPGLKSRVNDMVKAADRGHRLRGALANQVKQAQQKLSRTQSDTGALKFVLGKDPVNAVSSIFSSGDPERAMREILDTIGSNSAARDGLKVAVRDYILERATTSALQNTTTRQNPVAFARLDDLFKKHEDVLSQVYKSEEMSALRSAHKFLAPMKNREMQATVGSQTAERLGEQFWRYAEIGLKARYGILKGGGIMRTLRLWANTLPAKGEGARQLIEQMYFDPDLAAHLLTRNVDQVDTPAWNGKLNRLLGVTAGARDSDVAEDVEN